MAQLRQEFDEFQRRQAVIIVIGPENAAAFRKYFEQNALPFIGLPDEKHSVLKTYGQQVNLFKFGRMPAQMIIDKEGILRFVHYGHDMTDIPPNQELFDILDQLNQTT